MIEIMSGQHVEDKIVDLRGQKVIIDSDVAELYGVETKRINEAVKNNPEKFPSQYLFELEKGEWEEVKSKFSTSPLGGGKVKAPKAFTEKGLYMLATILKSPKATETTLVIIDTFSKVRELGRIVNQLPILPEGSAQQALLVERAGEVISDLVMPNHSVMRETEASVELNLAVVKLKYAVRQKIH